MSTIWRLETDEQQIGWLHFDLPEKSTNTLSPEAIAELDSQLDEIATKELKGLVIVSDKAQGFIVGADIEVFTKVVDKEAAEDFMHQAHAAFFKLEQLSMPTVAMIHGNCLGGGLELSLACDYRVAEEGACLGFPEVMLGIFPGFGGTVRSIERVGVIQAMTMMLSGRPVKGKRAQRMGLVDAAVPMRQLKRAAVQTVLEAKSGHRKQPFSLLNTVLNSHWGRQLVANILRKKTRKLVNPQHYEAPFALIRLWRKYGGNRKRMFEQEVKTVARLIITPQAQNLVRLFFLQNRLKGFGKGHKGGIKHIHVIGAGVMGGDIAAWCALQGLQVTLQDQKIEFVAGAIKRASAFVSKKLRSEREQQAVMDRLIVDVEGRGIARADMVLEAIVENLEIKQKLYQQVEPLMKEGAILATNTSGIPIDELAKVLAQPERLVGIHFFNPVAKMKLVEIIAGLASSQQTLDSAYGFVSQIRHLPLPVKSSPGFLVNRILMPYLMEAVYMVEEGIAAREVDRAALDFGMPMGPITLADKVGLDICLAVAGDLGGITGDRVPEFLQQWVDAGRLGLKSGEGFYRYQKGKMVKGDGGGKPGKDIADRLIGRIVNEAVACLHEGIIEDAELLDAGMVFGTGFAPFRGGVMRYIEEEGKEKILERMQRLERSYGERFKGGEGWKAI